MRIFDFASFTANRKDWDMVHRFLSFVLLIFAAFYFTLQTNAAVLHSGPLEVQYDGYSGLSIKYNDIPIVVGSTIQVYAPGWKASYFSNYGAGVSVSSDKDHIYVTFKSSAHGFSGNETFQIAGQSLSIQLHVLWSESIPAYLELNLGQIWSPSFIGLPLQVIGAGSAVESLIPVNTRSSLNNPDLLANNFTSLIMNGRACKMVITGSDLSNGSVLLDGRNTDRGWAQDSPNLWLGMLGIPLPQNQPVSFNSTITFSPSNATKPVSPLITAQFSNKQTLIFRLPSHPVLVPEPKQVIWNQKMLGTDPSKGVLCQLSGENKDMLTACNNLGYWLKSMAGIPLKLTAGSQKPQIRLAINRSAGNGHNEGYDLTVGDRQAVVTGHDAAGLFYGIQTLVDLLTSQSGKTAFCGCAIKDWPTFPFRGAHLFVGKQAKPFEEQLIRRVFSHLKMNKMVLECEYTQWESDPAIWTDFSMSKADLSDLVEYARSHYMDPIPLIETLGHSEWIFRNGQNRQWAEETDDPHGYSPTAPGIYDFVYKIYSEAIRLFKPKIFHIGHDEINTFGQYPVRPADIQLGTGKIFTNDVHTISSWLAGQGIRTMLWGDMMLDSQEVKDGSANALSLADAQSARKSLLPGTIAADWHYGQEPPQNFNSLSLFKSDNLPTVACTWYNPINIHNFAMAAKTQHSLGLLQTNWSGWDLSEKTLENVTNQFTAYVLAADYAWSGREEMPDALPYNPSNLFRHLWNNESLPIAVLKGKVAALPSAYPDMSIGQLPPVAGDGWRFGGLSGRLDFAGALATHPAPLEASLKINGTVRGIAIAGGCRFAAAINAPILDVTVRFKNGKTITSRLLYGEDIAAVNDNQALLGADIIPAGQFGKDTLHWSIWQWRNPDPRAPIESVQIISDHPYAQPFIGWLAVY
jgi:hypothetical protein